MSKPGDIVEVPLSGGRVAYAHSRGDGIYTFYTMVEGPLGDPLDATKEGAQFTIIVGPSLERGWKVVGHGPTEGLPRAEFYKRARNVVYDYEGNSRQASEEDRVTVERAAIWESLEAIEERLAAAVRVSRRR